MNIKTIIFDFGKVIGHFDYAPALAALAGMTAIPADQVTSAVYALEDAYESGELSTTQFLGQLRALCQFHCSDDDVARTFADIFRPNQPVCELIPRLKPHYRLLLGSNTNELHSRRFREQFAETLRHFDSLVLSHEARARKPKRAFYDYAQRLAGCAPEECLFIDDMPANIEAARASGWQGIVYHDYDDLRGRMAALNIRGV